MTPEVWQRLKPLYNAALELPEEDRSRYVSEACGDDAELARELRALLAADKSAANTLDPPLAGAHSFLFDQPSAFEPGSVLAGRFRIVRHLGSGGMGDVYEALDEQMEQGRIALKTIRPMIAENPAALARFKEEVRLARKVTGPNVCRIHELYLSSRTLYGPAFLTMELLEGETLHEHIASASPLSVPEIRRIAEQLCAALCCIHEAGIVHQDLKPRNVMLVPQNGTERAVVMDFGLARAATLEPRSVASQEGLIAGTPSYMAPEQFEGREVGPATDIYALGLILYEMATGQQPFAANTVLAAAIRRSKRPRYASSVRRDLPPAWDEVIDRCLRYEPEERYQSAAQVSAALIHSHTVVLRVGGSRRLAIPKSVINVGALVCVVLLCAGIWFAFGRPRHPQLAPEAAHWYGMGMMALREGSYMKAIRLLEQVEERDPGYALAHAALADAWTELDFTEAAQREMLLASAPNAQQGLREPERRYINAVRSTMIRDYSAAAQDYEAILKDEPRSEKADGYVDLGRIYEKAGKVRETVAAYEEAAQLNPDDPAPFLHLGILKSRLRDAAAAEQAFNHAEALYSAESDLEGVGEVMYQRGNAANNRGSFAQAKQDLQRSLSIARQISSVQLEVRSLSQLSSVANREGRDEEAVNFANEEVDTARKSGLEYWVTDGKIRLGNALLDERKFPDADAMLRDALQQSKQNEHPRLEASAELSFASLRNLEKKWDEQISFARAAFQYFQDYGFLNSADQAETLILRGERDEGHFQQALESGNQLLKIAAQTHSTLTLALAQEFVGDLLMQTEHYPEALALFREGTHNLQTLGQDPGYQQLHTGEALWHLGRYAEADEAFGSISAEMTKRSDIAGSIGANRAEMEITQGKYRDALLRAQRLRAEPGADASELEMVELSAKVSSAANAADRDQVLHLIATAEGEHHAEEEAQGKMLLATYDLRKNEFAKAKTEAGAAEEYFAGERFQESRALALLMEAEASEGLGDSAQAAEFSRQSLESFRELEQNWGVPAFHLYITRPDRQKSMQALAHLLGQTGQVPEELAR